MDCRFAGGMPAARADARRPQRCSGCIPPQGFRWPAAAASAHALVRQCASTPGWSRPAAAVALGLHHPVGQRLGRDAELAHHPDDDRRSARRSLGSSRCPSRQVTSEGSTRGGGRRFPYLLGRVGSVRAGPLASDGDGRCRRSTAWARRQLLGSNRRLEPHVGGRSVGSGETGRSPWRTSRRQSRLCRGCGPPATARAGRSVLGELAPQGLGLGRLRPFQGRHPALVFGEPVAGLHG